MEDLIKITQINDFIFCPASIYFHNLYGDRDKTTYQRKEQINGTYAHEKIDTGTYTTAKKILMGYDVYCEELGLIGKIDMFDTEKCLLRERKKKIKVIYDGYVFQLYAQLYSLREMGYVVKIIQLYSMDDNKIYKISLPEDDAVMDKKFKDTIENIRNFSMEKFIQTNKEKCIHCIYEPACDKTILEG